MKTLVLSMDYNCQPINIGDFIQNLLVCSILVDRNILEAIDVNIINDPELEHADPQIAHLLSEGNKKRKIFDIIQSLQLVPNIRNIKFYRQATEVIEHYKTTIYQSQVFWPSLEHLAEQKYFFYDAAQLICNHILETRTYPVLNFSDFQINKAHQSTEIMLILLFLSQ
ncbi:hypothetical protein [Geotalea toluenoxydans]|uniref:hypothetical protein n=1 Tax=Geotalea toluenoxydans TaxID=421624 RepID=UPI000AB02BB8|nr:hypothetical protein [Geotalea toluenoxydans]